MNETDVNILKESIYEYCEEIFGICIGYMSKNNIDYNLTGSDELSMLLREVRNIQDNIKNVDSSDTLNKYKDRLIVLNKAVRGVIGNNKIVKNNLVIVDKEYE